MPKLTLDQAAEAYLYWKKNRYPMLHACDAYHYEEYIQPHLGGKKLDGLALPECKSLLKVWEDDLVSPIKSEILWNLAKKIVNHMIKIREFSGTNPFSQYQPPSDEGENVIRMPGTPGPLVIDTETMDIIW